MMNKKYDGAIMFDLAATFEKGAECYKMGECYAMPLEYHKRADRRAHRKYRNHKVDAYRHNAKVYFAGVDFEHSYRRAGKKVCRDYMDALPQEQYLDAVERAEAMLEALPWLPWASCGYVWVK